MDKDSRILLRILYALILVGAIGWAFMLERQNKTLNRVITMNQDNVSLSRKECDMLIADLESSDPTRIEDGIDYLRFRSAPNTIEGRSMTFRETARIYKTKEWPRRSKEFLRLVAALDNKQDTATTTENELIEYLGEPDEKVGTPKERAFRYNVSYRGVDAIAIFGITNGSVSSVEVVPALTKPK
jgi:hypothetical protein